MANSNNITLHYVAFAHSGKLHRQNQDGLLLAGTVPQKAGFWQNQICVNDSLRFAVADGIGGLASGGKASRILLQKLVSQDQSQPTLSPRNRLIPLQNRLVKACKGHHELMNAGATLITAEIATDGQITLWHAGDAQGYHYGDQGLSRLTDDHTLAYCLSRTGNHSKAYLQEVANTRMGQALGNLFIFSENAEQPFIGLQRLKLLPGEILLLISDGVTLHLSDDVLGVCLIGTDLVTNVRQIYDKVFAAGAQDNLSAIAIRYELMSYTPIGR